MPPLPHAKKEVWILAALFVAFVAFAAYYERLGEETAARNSPSSFNASPQGSKALARLLSETGFHVAPLQQNWRALGPDDRLLIVIEPLDSERPVTHEEVAALNSWVEQGGTVLYLVTAPPRPPDADDPLFGDAAIVNGTAPSREVRPETGKSPYLRDVQAIQVTSPVRLKPDDDADYETLFADKGGALALHKTVGKGHAILLAGSDASVNKGLRAADNAVFFVNVAAEAVSKSGGSVRFDEYHQGFGSETGETGPGVLASLPLPLRLAFWHGFGLFGLLVYNGNRRFGKAQSLALPAYRASTDYVGSMARLYRRAHAADIALLTLYKAFLRDLAKRLDLPPDTPPMQLAERARLRFSASQTGESSVTPSSENEILATVGRCEQVAAGERIGDAEMLGLTRKLEQFRRRWEI